MARKAVTAVYKNRPGQSSGGGKSDEGKTDKGDKGDKGGKPDGGGKAGGEKPGKEGGGGKDKNSMPAEGGTGATGTAGTKPLTGGRQIRPESSGGLATGAACKEEASPANRAATQLGAAFPLLAV